MKIALFSDVHANLPALKAFFQNVQAQKPDMIYCLGDLVGFNIWPNEVINEIRKRNIATLAGNHDFNIGRKFNKADPDSYDPKDPNRVSTLYTASILGNDEHDYLATLPLHIRLKFDFGNLLMVHGSATSIDELLFEDTSQEYLLSMMQDADADILCFGHTHKPFYKKLGSEKHAINIGSIGKPKDGDPRGCYVILDITGGQVDVKFARFSYNVEEAASAIEGSPLPKVYADMLRKAY